MKRVISGILLVAACSSVMADGWVQTTSNDTHQFSIKKGTGEITKNKAGEDIFVVIGRMYGKKSKKIDLEKWYVTVADCLKKEGKLVTLSLAGDFMYENDFVFQGGSIASANAELICGGYDYAKQETLEKGI